MNARLSSSKTYWYVHHTNWTNLSMRQGGKERNKEKKIKIKNPVTA